MLLGRRDRFDYVECRDCGCLQIEEIPDDLDRYYPSDDYYVGTQRVRRRRAGGLLGLRRAWSRFRLRPGRLRRAISGRRYAHFDWFRRTQTREDDAILDVGCGSGRLLWRLHREGFRHLVGIDEFCQPVAAVDSVGPRFEKESLERHRGTYHLVMAHHSFEHARDPRVAFEALASLVGPGGRLLLRMPLADGWARRHYGADWVQLDAPRHLHLHTRRSIARLAARAGFRVALVEDDSGPFQIWGSELLRRDIALSEAQAGAKSPFGLFGRLAARARARRLSRKGLGDQACFYLERKGDLEREPIARSGPT